MVGCRIGVDGGRMRMVCDIDVEEGCRRELSDIHTSIHMCYSIPLHPTHTHHYLHS